MVTGLVIALVQIFILFGGSYLLRNKFPQLKQIETLTYYWLTMTVLTMLWEICFVVDYNNTTLYALELLAEKTHIYTQEFAS